MADDPRSCGAILIVDDDGGLRTLLATLLEGAGHTVLSVATGEEALAAAKREPPALAILDVNLPGVCGYEVCHRLRALYGDGLPILFVSGERTESFDRVAGLLVGGDDYLVKPFAPDELLARVASLLRRAPSNGHGLASLLTTRELEILRLLADGRGQSEIASELVITSKTVATHIERILGKLGVHSRTQAVALAYRDGLLDT